MARRSKVIEIPARRQSPDSKIDGQSLKAKLTNAAESAKDIRPAILDILKSTLEAAKQSAQDHFEAGRLGGLETARLIASIHDDIIVGLFDFTTTHIVRSSNPTKSERISLCAVGGYGRGEMAPQSDVDLLFLTADKKGSPFVEQVTEYMLYMLWDLGLKVGHSVRTSEQSIKLAKEDQTILTSLLDLRYLCGDKSLANDLYTRFRKDITKGKGRAYIAAKLAERDARHEREGNSRYVIEPNVKEGKGGLRDLHALYWIARFLDKDGKINDAQQPQSYVEMGLFDKAAATRFVRAADFLWRTRIWLHYVSSRPTESLSFDKQTVLARKMGYASGAIEVAVEKFMREYFTNAKEVGALTRIACAKLEAEKAILLPKGLDVFLPNSRRNIKNTDFFLDHGRLMFSDPLKIKEKPSMILQLFETAGRRNLDIHPNAFSAIDFRRNLMDNDFRRSAENSAIFQKILLGARAPYATLKAMNEAGVLGRYLIEFGGIVARTQFNMHHAYTVDEHTLRLVDNFHNILSGDMEKEHPISTGIVKGFTTEQKLILYLACLLHDTGKGQGDQCIEGAQLGRRACRRLGVNQNVTDTVAWLIRRHLDMSETAQRRDISDPETIKEFAELVGSQDRLDMLTVLTTVDIRAVGPGIWNDWKGVLLRNLYQSTSAYLDGHAELAPMSRAKAAQEQLREKLSPEMAERITQITADLDTNYWLNFDMADLVRHARFFDQSLAAGHDTAVQTRRDRTRDITELWVMTRDRAQLFADITRAISASGASIIGARLHTGHNRRVMNVFYLQNPDGHAFGRQSDHALETLRRRARKAVEGDVEGLKIPTPIKSRRAGAIPIKARIKYLDSASGDTIIIEMSGRDRPGLLYNLAETLRDENLDVLSAHIEVVGIEAIDTFYVRCRGSDGNLPEKRRKALRKVLLNVLDKRRSEKKAA
ncbi:[protein-PII] uridylyltransferase [Hellea balneolensis]|uniref:[protein-PII] uridylyltransferase n=1 Tax=Hellea balneolensis TaxID=287478 RepID=UPI0003F95C42|nr:[protein-PII] uridylyltransferase [Hellea balneolensis]